MHACHRLIVCVVLLLASSAVVRTTDFLTEGGDAARTGWIRDERVFTPEAVATSTLLWRTQLDSERRARHNLLPPLIMERVATASGLKEIVVEAGVSDDLFGLDAATGAVLWRRHFSSTFTPPADNVPTFLCPGGQTAVPTAVAGPSAGQYSIYAVSWDGRLHRVNAADGTESWSPEKFIPPNGKVFALNHVKGTIYATTAQGCGGLPYAFFAFDIETRRTSAFLPAGGGLWGRRGSAVDAEGRVFSGTGDGPYDPENGQLGQAVVSVRTDANRRLSLLDYFAAPNANYLWKRDLDMNVTPVPFEYRGRKWVVATGKECVLYLLDRDNLGGPTHDRSVFTSERICNDSQSSGGRGVWGALAVWQDARDRLWIVVPFWGPVSRGFHAEVEQSRPEQGGVAAFTLESVNGRFRLVPRWLSRDIALAEEALVANGIVFTYGSGEPGRPVERAYDEPVPPVPKPHAVVYALDALTGRELWSSGNAIADVNHFSGLSVANGRVYLGTVDGFFYAFGVRQAQ